MGYNRWPCLIDFILGLELAVHDALILQYLQGLLQKLSCLLTCRWTCHRLLDSSSKTHAAIVLNYLFNNCTGKICWEILLQYSHPPLKWLEYSFTYACWVISWLFRNQQMQEVENIVGSEPDHWLLFQEIPDDVSSFAEGTHSSLTWEEGSKRSFKLYNNSIFLNTNWNKYCFNSSISRTVTCFLIYYFLSQG